MATVYFSNGTTAQVDNVRGDDPRMFTVADNKSFATFMQAFTDQSTLTFAEGGEIYLMTRLVGNHVTAVRQIRRR